jgi:hypothetical protein
MMPVPIIEVVGWVLWEFIFAFIFYNSGSVFLRLLSFGKVKNPIISPSAFRKEKPQLQNASLCYLVGMVFYMSLVIIFIVINNS